MMQAASQFASAWVHSRRPWCRSRRSWRNRKYLHSQQHTHLYYFNGHFPGKHGQQFALLIFFLCSKPVQTKTFLILL